jgi:glucose-1-phosphate thymidylyltransferase
MERFLGILPAAGTGSRLLPFSYPKELLPVIYRWSDDGTKVVPTLAIEYALMAVERARVERCMILVSKSKPEIIRYLGNGEDRGTRIAYVVQEKPMGLADAVNHASQWVSGPECNCCLVLPDTFFEPADALRQVNEELVCHNADLVLGVFPTESPGDLGPVRVNPDRSVAAVFDKPVHTELRNTWGLAAWSPQFSRLLHERIAAIPGTELILGSVFDLACRNALRVRAVTFTDGVFHDMGTQAGLARMLRSCGSAHATTAYPRVAIGVQRVVGDETQSPTIANGWNRSRERPDHSRLCAPNYSIDYRTNRRTRGSCADQELKTAEIDQTGSASGPRRKRPRRHLLVALHDRSLGRAEIALRVGKDLRAQGDEVHFVAHDSTSLILNGSGFGFDKAKGHLGGLTRLLLDQCVRRVKPTNIIYFDYFNTSNYLRRMGIHNTQFLLAYDCATMTLDIWDYRQTGSCVDMIGGEERSLVLGDVEEKLAEFDRIPTRLIPVPLAPCEPEQGRFACLPDIPEPFDRSTSRRKLAVPEGDPMALFCTSGWQYPQGCDSGIQKISEQLPKLIAEYLRQVKRNVHLEHVGPMPYPLHSVLGDHYHWRAPLETEEFDKLLSNARLLISANVSSITIAKAIQMHVPVLVLKNSYTVRDPEEAQDLLGCQLSRHLRNFVRETAPVYPFVLWPLGYHRFLQPLLAANPYCEAFDFVELLDESSFIRKCQLLISDGIVRNEMSERQRQYVENVRRLSSAAEVIHQFVD